MEKREFRNIVIILILFALVAVVIFRGFFTGMPISSEPQAQEVAEWVSPNTYDVEETIDKLWLGKKDHYIKFMKDRIDDGSTYGLYDIQGDTNNLLRYAFEHGKYDIISDLSAIYTTAFENINSTATSYNYIYSSGCTVDNVTAFTPALNHSRMWLQTQDTYVAPPYEVVLNSAQFLYLSAYAINHIMDIPASDRTEEMNKFVETASPIIAEHYNRWVYTDKIFGMAGFCQFRCIPGTFSHTYYIDKLLSFDLSPTPGNRSSFCNVVRDRDLWIIAGVAEMISAREKNSTIFRDAGRSGISNNRTNLIKTNYLPKSSRLIWSRMIESDLNNFSGSTTKGMNFDSGLWKDNPDFFYSGYGPEQTDSPLGMSKKAVSTGWDISHFRRFVHVLDSLYNTSERVENPYAPTPENLTRLANQMIYGAFNKDLSRPLFSNYVDGTNGWYRVNYTGLNDPGYAPYSLSESFSTGGYAFWKEYNQDIRYAAESVFKYTKLSIIKDNSTSRIDGINFGANYGAGRIGRALSLTNGAYFSCGRILGSEANSTGTIEFGFRANANNTNKLDTFVHIANGSDYFSIRRHSDNKIQVLIKNGTTVVDIRSNREIFADGRWRHVAVTQNGTGIGIYIDGVYSSSSNSLLWTEHLNGGVCQSDGGDNYYINGSIDELRIYTRALPAAEINYHYYGVYLNNLNLIRHYGFDEGFDVSGLYIPHENVINNSVAPTLYRGTNYGGKYVAGKIGTALSFNNRSYYKFDTMARNNRGAIEFWFKANDNNRVNDILRFENNAQYFIIRRHSDNKIQVFINDSSQGVNLKSTHKIFADGKWHHVLATQNGTGIGIYIDGVYSSSSNSLLWTEHLNGGVCQSDRGNNYINGSIDELRIYTRALPAGEVGAHYKGVYLNNAGLVGYYAFDKDNELRKFTEKYYPVNEFSLLRFLPSIA